MSEEARRALAKFKDAWFPDHDRRAHAAQVLVAEVRYLASNAGYHVSLVDHASNRDPDAHVYSIELGNQSVYLKTHGPNVQLGVEHYLACKNLDGLVFDAVTSTYTDGTRVVVAAVLDALNIKLEKTTGQAVSPHGD